MMYICYNGPFFRLLIDFCYSVSINSKAISNSYVKKIFLFYRQRKKRQFIYQFKITIEVLSESGGLLNKLFGEFSIMTFHSS
jgi:hypothetical protein